MMAAQGRNEGFHVLDEFVCDAIQSPSIPLANPANQGRNEGMSVVEELVVSLGTEAKVSEEEDDGQEAVDRLLSAISELPPDYRAIFARRLSGISVSEISDLLGISPSLTAARFHRLLNKLQEQFAARGDK
jgi:RNA polymerase sigma factor (sigma-70 family)